MGTGGGKRGGRMDSEPTPKQGSALSSMRPARGANHQSRITSYAASAFTLVELMTVILVITIVSGIVIAGAGYAHQRALRSRTQATIQQLCTGISAWRSDRNEWNPPDLNCTTDGGALRAIQPVWPCEALWFWMEYWGPHQQYPKEPYMVFKREQVAIGTTKINASYDPSAGNFLRVVDAWGNPLNYKSNDNSNLNSYKFSDGTYAPRHNTQTYDICSYGANGTTWSDRDKSFNAQQDLSLTQLRSVTAANGLQGQIPNYFFKPFDILVTSGGAKHCYGGEDNDDINNWR